MTPFIHDLYWFVDSYIVLMLLVPYLNIVFINVDRNEYKWLIIIVSIFASLLSPINSTIFTNEIQFGFIIPAYLVGAYFRKYQITLQIPLLKAILSYVIAIVGASALYFTGHIRYINFFFFGIFQLISASYIFNFVMQRKSFSNKGVNVIAKTVFAAYLLTDNPNIRNLLWGLPIFHCKNSSLLKLDLFALLLTIMLMICATLIDLLRLLIFSIIRKLI